MIVVLSKHATDWLHVRVGQIDGYIPLKFVQIIKPSSVTPENLNRERKLNGYEYDDQGRRLKPNGERRAGATRLKLMKKRQRPQNNSLSVSVFL